ncbi:unnamed protein product [Miscanthus lutarioriparius]|uniref:MOB kinase activator-like 1A n=1 Tax=Miscanthus lutarioriparius TaxID=422564 RepID=A0A811MCW0_9POAL|nr:unnamed protein product [Miscanthus lutarioriparius]
MSFNGASEVSVAEDSGDRPNGSGHRGREEANGRSGSVREKEAGGVEGCIYDYLNLQKNRGGKTLFRCGLLMNRNQKTFRPKKNAPSGNKGVQLKKHIDATLGSGNLRDAVRLPPGEDLNEWLAVNTVDFFNQVNILYGTLMEFCTPATCPTMSAGPKFEYRWADGVQIKKPIEVSAPKYVEYLMDWIEAQLDDESIFPQKLGTPFPQNFKEVVKTIFKRLFRVYAHIYHSHFQKIVSLKEEAHLNTCFKHFTLFTWEFKLIDKAELAPLIDLIESIVSVC